MLLSHMLHSLVGYRAPSKTGVMLKLSFYKRGLLLVWIRFWGNSILLLTFPKSLNPTSTKCRTFGMYKKCYTRRHVTSVGSLSELRSLETYIWNSALHLMILGVYG
jgi:hypothetical protein